MKFKNLILATLALTLSTAAPALAELRHVEIKTLGMDWEICAHAVSVAMKKVDGVQNVTVSLKDGLTILDLKQGNTITLAKLRQVIKNNGFLSKEAKIIARGMKGPSGFEVSGTGERLSMSSNPEASESDGWHFTVPAPR